MSSATPPSRYLCALALALAVTGGLAPGARADSMIDETAIATEEDASAYVLGILSGAGCRMRFSAFRKRLAADGLDTPSGAADDPGTLVAAAPLRLFNEGLITEDPGDPQILISSGPGCD